MTVQEIFDSLLIKEIEEEMIDLDESISYSSRKQPIGEVETIRTLIRIRRNLITDMFVMDEHYKKLLLEFNDILKSQLIQMRKETIKAVQSVMNAGVTGEIQGVGKCYLGYRYSELHPVQTTRAKKVWAILNGTIDDYVHCYEDGVLEGGYMVHECLKPDSENQMLYLNKKTDNWNDGLDRVLTKDMNLIYPIHHLVFHTDFSIFDLLWVRDFNVEIHIESDYKTNQDVEEKN